MSQEVTMIARTFAVDSANSVGKFSFSEEARIFGGKMAGICYGSEAYLDEGIKNVDKAKKRANMVLKNGHFSTMEHFYATLIIKTNKIVAMVLNSCGVYTTSEKSARYTEMKPESELENYIYHKWIDKFEPLFKEKYPEKSDKDINKLAMENARYLISVFTPTYMAYTISYRQASLICNYIDKLESDINTYDIKSNFLTRVVAELKDLQKALIDELGLKDENGDYYIKDNKDESFRLFNLDKYKYSGIYFKKSNSINDSYTLSYRASFAYLAQAQRHRTIRYSIDVGLMEEYELGEVYVPCILYNHDDLLDEWHNDAKDLRKSGVVIQGAMIPIYEQGILEDFILKCKERLCFKAQEEIRLVTADNLMVINATMRLDDNSRVSSANRGAIAEYINGRTDVYARCKCGFKCAEPCKYYNCTNLRDSTID